MPPKKRKSKRELGEDEGEQEEREEVERLEQEEEGEDEDEEEGYDDEKPYNGMNGTEIGRLRPRPPVVGNTKGHKNIQKERKKHTLPEGLPLSATDSEIRAAGKRGEIWQTLFYAVVMNRPDVVRRLFELGINPDTRIPRNALNPYGARYVNGPFGTAWNSPTAFQIALIYHRERMVRVLMEYNVATTLPMTSTVMFRSDNRIFIWEYDRAINYIFLHDFSEKFFLWFLRKEQQLRAKEPGIVSARWEPLMALARWANKNFHYNRLVLLLTHDRLREYRKITLDHLKVAARGTFPHRSHRSERNVVRERILHRLILETKGGYDGTYFAQLLNFFNGVHLKTRDPDPRPEIVAKLRRMKAKTYDIIPTKRIAKPGTVRRDQTVQRIAIHDSGYWRQMEREWRANREYESAEDDDEVVSFKWGLAEEKDENEDGGDNQEERKEGREEQAVEEDEAENLPRRRTRGRR